MNIPPNHCNPCPTYHGHINGHDPESYAILMSEDWCRHMRAEMPDLWCPWRNAPCVVYPAELDWAIEYYDRGEIPPVKLHPKFQ